MGPYAKHCGCHYGCITNMPCAWHDIILNKYLLSLLCKISSMAPAFQKFIAMLERGEIDKHDSSGAIQALQKHSYIMSLAQKRGSINSG